MPLTAGGVDDPAAGVLRGVAVAAAEAAGDDAPRRGVLEARPRRRRPMAGRHDVGAVRRRAPPAGERLAPVPDSVTTGTPRPRTAAP